VFSRNPAEPSIDSVRWIGVNVQKGALSIAFLNCSGKPMKECAIETKAITILDFLNGLRASLQVTPQEGTWRTPGGLA
jgi:hypothetical protein